MGQIRINPSEFTDEACYQAYLKAEAAGLVSDHGKSRNPSRLPVSPGDFTDEACYLAYMKAEAAGLVRTCGESPVAHDQRATAQAPAPAVNKPAALSAPNGCLVGGIGGQWADCQDFIGIAVLKAI